MSSLPTHAEVLVPHSSRGDSFVRALRVHVRAGKAGILEIVFALHGDLARLRLPPFTALRCADRLWEHSCFEVFIAGKGSPAYCEFNFSPSGAWAVYAFSDYRKAIPLASEDMIPHVEVNRAADLLELDIRIPLPRSSSAPEEDTPVNIGCSAVIEDESGDLSYWALVHGASKPDFHRREAFVLEVDAQREAVVRLPTVRGHG